MKEQLIILTVITVVLWISVPYSHGQVGPPDELIAITARPSADSITLRWAPMRYDIWKLANEVGYRIERFHIAHNGNLVADREREILHPALKPLAENQWENLVSTNRYAAITAQALFGERFEIDLRNSDAFAIVNKARENDQRFSFALFSADMSPKVARASGLMFSDHHAKKGDKYLYRIVVNTRDSIRGSVFISPDDPYLLPKPSNLTAEFKGALVYLKWDKNANFNYTAFRLEKSEDGKHFRSVSDAPLVTVSPTEMQDTRFNYAIDSVVDSSATTYYRVKGITPFGEESQPSEVISGKGMPTVNQVPYIASVENPNNQSLEIRWVFPPENNDAIAGFTLERAPNPNKTFVLLTQPLLSPETRTYTDDNPGPVNYYRVTALGPDGSRYPSPVFYGQLIDSIPPASPGGLRAEVTEQGVVTISWNANEEPDIYGYRVYKANYKSEELAQVTTMPVGGTSFVDRVGLHTLNEYAYYQVMALDKNQNHSQLSPLLEVVLPDKVPPQPPVLLPVKTHTDGVDLSWIPSPSADVTRYQVYGKTSGESQWELLTVIENTPDTIFHYRTKNSKTVNKTVKQNLYTVIAIDDAGLESSPTPPVTGGSSARTITTAVKWKKPVFNRAENQVSLRWVSEIEEVEFYRIYRAVFNGPPLLYKVLPGSAEEFTDTLRPTEDYTYRIMAILPGENKSRLSEALLVDY